MLEAMRGPTSQRSLSALPTRWPGDPVNLLGLKALGLAISASAAAADFASGLLTQTGSTGGEGAAGEAAAKLVQRMEWPTRPLRLGVVNPGAWTEALHEAGDNENVQWLEVPEESGAEATTDYLLDGLLRVCEEDRIELVTLLRSGRGASWYDWGMERPLSYASVFPLQLDCEKLTCSLTPADSPEFVRALIECAAWSSRWPGRITLRDRVSGRNPCLSPRARSSRVKGWQPHTEPFALSVANLMQHVCAQSRTIHPTSSMKAAARLVSAWLTTDHALMTDQVRRGGIESCAAIAGEEPEVMLRLAAARLACVDDVGGLEAIRAADQLLRGVDALPGVDPYAFLRAEMAGDQSAPLAVGRLAAGICMLAATMSAEKLRFVREDLAEDMQFSGLLIGREQDQRLLLDVMRTLELSRRDAAPNVAAA